MMGPIMSEYPLTLEGVVLWLKSKAGELDPSKVQLAEMRERRGQVPAVGADFDSPGAMGRINVWVSGQFDFEVLRISDGKNVLFRHEAAAALDAAALDHAFSQFVQTLANPQSTISRKPLKGS